MTSKTLIRSILICGLLLVVLCWMHIDVSDARPGGGSSFSSGRSSSSSSSSSRSSSRSSSSGGHSDEFPWLLKGILYLLDILFSYLSLQRGISGIRGTDPGIKARYPNAFVRFIMCIIVMIVAMFAIAAVWFDPIAAFLHMFVTVVLMALVFGAATNSSPGIVSAATIENLQADIEKADQRLAQFKLADPNFSKVVFLDFASALYHKYYAYRGTPEFHTLAPFFSEPLRQDAMQPKYAGKSVSEIVIGSMSMDIRPHSSNDETPATTGMDRITVEFNVNYTVTDSDGQSTRFITVERWQFERQCGVLSQKPDRMRTVSCPACGGPASFTDAGKCSYCNTMIHYGSMQWSVKTRIVPKIESFQTREFGTYAEEVGTDLPTLKQPALPQAISEFSQAHRIADWTAYWDRFTTHIVTPFFHKIYDAWTRRTWQEVRHLVSDRLYESNNFWIEAYRRENLVNKLDETTIQRCELTRIDIDRFYEAFTVRIFASCFDYVETEEGKLVGGSKTKKREFSEYWTFLRRTGVEIDEASVTLNTCPSCGAPADKIGQAGECGYCGSTINRGDFSWVLAVITQDEVYQG